MAPGPNQSIGEGALYVPVAKVWFIVVSFVLNFGLPNLLSAREVGDYGVVNRLISLLTMMMITGGVQTVAKYVSEDPANAPGVLRSALRLQALFGGGTALLCFVAAPYLAAFFRDPDLVATMRVAATIPLAYGFYSLVIGILNGERRFRVQALFDIGYATLRVTAILGAAALGFGVLGVFTSFALASAIIALFAFWFGRANLFLPGRPLAIRPLLQFAAPIFAFVLVSQWLLSFDLFWVKRLIDPAQSKELAGAYFALSNISLVPYMLTVSISSIIFPLVSHATFVSDRDRMATYIRQSLRIALLVATAMESVVAASPDAVIRLLYPSKPAYLEYASTLQVLCAAYAFLSVTSIMMTVLNGSGKPRTSLTFASICLVTQGTLAATLVPGMGLLGASVASLCAFVLVFLVASLHLLRVFGTTLSAVTLLRTAVAAGAAVLVGRSVSHTGTQFLVEAALVAAVFLFVLVVLGELGRSDWRHFTGITRHR